MPQPQPTHEVEPSREFVTAVLSHEESERLTVPVVGEVDVALGLGQPLKLEIDADAIELQFGSGLEVRPVELPSARLRRLYIDLVDGVVETDSDGLGGFVPRAVAVALCSVLRHTLGWTPGGSMLHAAAKRLFPDQPDASNLKFRRRFPGVSASLDPLAILSVEVRGDAIEVAVSRPLLIRAVGLSLSVLRVRYDFATATVEVVSAPIGPVRRALVRVAGRQATKWLRKRLPAAMAEPGYDLFADPDRREHLLELVHNLRADDKALPQGEPLAGAEGTPGHPNAREGEGGAASLFSGTKAALATALTTMRISADNPPEATRKLFTIPLGPFSSLAVATDRGGDVAFIKDEQGLRIDAPRGIYLYSDQFPELAELRLVGSQLRWGRDDKPVVEFRAEPALGPLLDAVVQRVSDQYLAPIVPAAWLRDHGVLPSPHGSEQHVLWRQPTAGEPIVAHTGTGQYVELRHTEEALVLSAPGGLSLGFPGSWHVPPTQLRRIAYRWEDGALEIDGDPNFGEFGQALLSGLARKEGAPRAPKWIGMRGEGGPKLDEERLARFSVEVFGLSVPVLGRVELRMDPQDTAGGSLGPTELTIRSERGLFLVLRDLGLMLELRSARYDLPKHELVIDSTPPAGDYLQAFGVAALEAFALPLLRKVVPLWPDADPSKTWVLRQVLAGFLGEKLGLAFDLTLPPGASVTVARVSGALVLGATAPLQVRPVGESLIGEFAVEAVRWRPDGEQIELVTQPPAGPLLHALVRRLHAHFTPKIVMHALAERLGLPQAWPPPPLPPTPTSMPLGELGLPVVGPLTIHVDRQRPFAVQLRRDGAHLDFGEGCVVRMPDLGIHVDALAAKISLMPFTLELTSRPAAGELDSWLLGHVVRGMLARVLPWFWPARHTTEAGDDVLVAFGASSSWGPIELTTAPGGALELSVDAEGVALRSTEGIRLAGAAFADMPSFTLHETAYRFADGSVHVGVAGIEEKYYREPSPVSPRTEQVLADLLRMLVIPRMPAWTQRLGLRILPQPPAPEPDPGRITVLQAQLPGGFAQVRVHVAPGDVLTVSANRREAAISSERGLQLDMPGPRLRVDFHGARYHLESGEIQFGEFGQLENALVEAVVRKSLAGIEPNATQSDYSAVAAVLDRFPVDDEGRRVLYDSKLARVLLPADTMLVVRISEHGLLVTADPPIEIDGATVLDYKFAGVSYSFDDAHFHIDLEKDGVLAGLLRGKIASEVEKQLDSLARPLLPAAMREPGYRLATDPDPKATIAALVRTVVGSSWFLST
ncbi:hypothetical protein [Nannocystis bainbridge]|uniref:Uncharacterized protein n=1 Tax=Nannocystis bainbridge TaxID=2995303 RepID=A0ABT5E8E9_9BACT|nr:hypothetical protein [Nannocystis bainbridge]MDC0721614.1 hypothetical protein [Nannocystis bainbridge]